MAWYWILAGLATAPVVMMGMGRLLLRGKLARPAHSRILFTAKMVTIVYSIIAGLLEWLAGGLWGNALAVAVYGFLFVGMMGAALIFGYAVSEHSIHVHLLARVAECREAGWPVEEWQRTYNKRIIIEKRLPRMLALGQIELQGERYILTGQTMLLSGQFIKLLQWLLGIPPYPLKED